MPDAYRISARKASPQLQDGVSAALEIHREIGIRAIFISAYGSNDLKLRAQPAQPFGWVQKPIQPRELKNALARVRGTL